YLWSYENDKIVEYSGTSVVGRHNSIVSDIVFSSDGNLVATSSFDWSVHLFNFDEISRQQQPIIINDFNNWVTGIRFTIDSKKLIAYGADRTVRVWDINIHDLYKEVTKKVTRDMTVEEWNKYVGKDVEFNKISAHQ
ncbi:MAG: WD40 repeat domain-containing protein, partial [Runella zeae]